MQAKRAHLFIKGRVQGVCYRAFTSDTANSLALSGWVRNLHDGRVEAVFEGGDEDVTSIVDWCHDGPPGSSVSGVDVKWEEHKDEFKGFEITYN